MSVDPLGQIIPGVAGAPAAQITGADVGRTQQTAGNQKRRVASRERAESTAGICAPDGPDLATNDRDPDGRQACILPDAQEQMSPDDTSAPVAPGKAAGDGDQRGRRIDLVG